MTKSITISYEAADEHLLLALFKKLKINIIEQSSENTEKNAVKQSIKDAAQEVKAHMNNEIELTDFWESLDNIEKEIVK